MAATDSANIGANFSNYTGSAPLGGLDIGVINIDTKPLQDLARFTMIANKAQQEQKQREIEARAKQLADLTAYDLTTAIPKDREIVQKEYNDLFEYARNNPTVLDYKKNPEGWMEYNRKKNALENTLKSAKTRSILYTARQNEASKATDPRLKALLERNLESEVKNTGIQTPLRITEQFDLSVPNIPAPAIKSFDVTVMGSNENVSRQYKMVDFGDINAKAAQISLGMNSDVLDTNSPQFTSASPDVQRRMIQEFETQKAGGKLITIEQADQYNAALNGYKDANGNIDINLVASKNPILAGVMKSFEDYNKYVTKVRDDIKSGVFTDKLGNTVQFGVNGLSEYDYQPISYTDGITPEELIKVQILAKATPDSFKTTVQETDDKLQEDQLKQKTQNDAENRAIERARLAQTKREWETGMTASETLRNSAWKYGQDIISQLDKIKDKGSAILPSQFGKLNNEILMALGTEQAEERDADGKITKKAGFYPLELKPGNVMRVVGDNVYVYNNAGEFSANPVASTSLANIATNRLIRALKASSGKEINLFTGVDDVKAPVTSTDSKTRTASGSSGSVRMVLPDGRVGEIPADQVDAFLKENPKAKRAQ